MAYLRWPQLGAYDREVMQRMTEPVDNIYTCNEAYSDMQGWENGSLRSADHVLSKFAIVPLVDDRNNVPCCQDKQHTDCGRQ